MHMNVGVIIVLMWW